jgi:hypothetical protein
VAFQQLQRSLHSYIRAEVRSIKRSPQQGTSSSASIKLTAFKQIDLTGQSPTYIVFVPTISVSHHNLAQLFLKPHERRYR